MHCIQLQGIIHRDLKANNIFCSAHGIVKLGDFGISKALGDNQNVARTMVGTPYYMSPEILKVCRCSFESEELSVEPSFILVFEHTPYKLPGLSYS